MNTRSVLIKIFKVLGIVGGVLIIYGLMGFYLLPAVLKAKLPEMIEQNTGRKSSVEKIEFDPFLLRFNLEGFVLQELNGQPFFRFDRFYADLNAFRSLKNQALALDRVLLAKPWVRIAWLKNGQFNFADLLVSEPEPEKEDETVFPLLIEKLSLSEGHLVWEDARFGKPLQEEIVPIELEVEQLATYTADTFPIRFSTGLKSSGQLDWQGVASIQGMSSSGRIRLNKISLQRIQELAVQDQLAFELRGSQSLELDYKLTSSEKELVLDIEKSRFEIQDLILSTKGQEPIQGKLSKVALEADYKVGFSGAQWRIVSDKTRLNLSDIQLAGLGKAALGIPAVELETRYQAENQGSQVNFKLFGDKLQLRGAQMTEAGRSDPLVEIPLLAASGIGLDLGKQELSVDKIKAENGKIKAWLDTEGRINYQQLLPEAKPGETSSKSSQSASSPPPSPAPWKIALKQIEVDNFALAFEDRTQKTPVLMNIKPIRFRLDNYSNKNGLGLPLQFSAGINETGSLKLDGDAVIEPFSARLNVDIRNIALDTLQPYVEKYARLDLIDGNWSADGKLSAGVQEEDRLDLKFKGNTAIAELLTRDQILHKDFVKWKKLTLEEIDADVLANRYTAKRLLINKPYARVIIEKDKTINVNDVFMADKNKAGKEGKPVKPEKSVKPPKSVPSDRDQPNFKLDKVQVVDGASDFADLSLILPFAAQIKSLSGGASGISSAAKSTIKISLKGNAYDLAPVSIDGEISPYQGEFNVEMNFMGMPMPLISPYMVQFAGYKVEKGKLNLGLKYQVAKGQLTASNNILIDQFELGEKVENPDAVSVPLELAVGLLKDSSGKIKMDVPITGSLEDPQFSVGKIIADALLNSITKIVTSPFNAIASLVGNEENLDAVIFAPGKAELDQEQVKKLYGIASALKERPILSIDIKGAAYQEQDWPALRESALYDRLKKMKADEINKKGGPKILAEYVELSEEEYKRLLAQLFIEKFPLLADRSLFGTPRLKDPKAGDFYEVAKQKLAAIIKPEPNRLKSLASERAQAIAKYLVQQGGVQNERVYILDPAIDPKREGDDAKKIISFLSLKAQ
jgi:hypothetical protein